MKTIVTTICILISSIGFSQEVFILDEFNNHLNETPIDESKVKEYLKDYPIGTYFTVAVKATEVDGDLLFERCVYPKVELKLESI